MFIHNSHFIRKHISCEKQHFLTSVLGADTLHNSPPTLFIDFLKIDVSLSIITGKLTLRQICVVVAEGNDTACCKNSSVIMLV